MSWKIILPIFASLIILAGCGGRATRSPQESTLEPTDSPVSNPTATSTSAAEQQSPDVNKTGAQVDGGTLIRLGADPSTLDPHLTTDATSANTIIEVFGGLVTIDPELNIVPDLAESWDISRDGRIYTFHLRKDGKFHNGKPVTANDFKWSFERVANPATASPVVDQYLGDVVGVKERLKGDVTEVRGVRVVDNYTLEITIDEPKSYFLAKLTYPTAFVLDRENVESGRRWFREPNGTGPFMLTEYLPGESLVLTRNENYQLGPPHLAQVRSILSGGTSMLMYENDEIHIAGVGLADLDRISDPTNPLNNQLMKGPPTFSTDYIGMNVNEPPFDDPKVRQALNYAINKEAIARDVLADLVVPATGILPPDFPGYNPNLNGYKYDPELARQLLRESKYGDDLENFPRIILTTAGSFGSSVSLDMEVILAMWEENLGIQVEIQQTEFATYLQDLIKRRFQMYQIGWIADYPDPENFLDILFNVDSSNNHTGYNNSEVNDLLQRARLETNQEARYELYNKAEQQIIDDAPWIPLWYSGERHVLVKPYVHDYKLTQLIIPKLRFVYMTER